MTGSEVVVQARPAGWGSGCVWLLASLALGLAILSLLLNVALVAVLLQYRSFFTAAIDQAVVSLDEAARSEIEFDFPISQTIDFEGDVPFEQEFDFPVSTDVRVNTTVQVPIDLGPLGQRVIVVPIDATVPVNASVPVRIEQVFHVKTKVPVRTSVPVRLSPRQPPLRDWLDGVRRWLVLLRDQL